MYPTIEKPSEKYQELYSKFTHDLCNRYDGANGASVHSFEEQWFLYHYATIKPNYSLGDAIGLGGYRYEKKTEDSVINVLNWYDGSTADYYPEWGYNKADNVWEPYPRSNGLCLMYVHGEMK